MWTSVKWEPEWYQVQHDKNEIQYKIIKWHFFCQKGQTILRFYIKKLFWGLWDGFFTANPVLNKEHICLGFGCKIMLAIFRQFSLITCSLTLFFAIYYFINFILLFFLCFSVSFIFLTVSLILYLPLLILFLIASLNLIWFRCKACDKDVLFTYNSLSKHCKRWHKMNFKEPTQTHLLEMLVFSFFCLS